MKRLKRLARMDFLASALLFTSAGLLISGAALPNRVSQAILCLGVGLLFFSLGVKGK